MEQRSITHADSHGGEIDPRVALAVWLKSARARRRMSVDDVARVTKIQPRFLERLEAGEICSGEHGMPAEVFVRGFVRSFARCVGLDESEALERYQAIERGGGVPAARALVDSMMAPPAEPEPALPALPADPVTVTATATATATEPLLDEAPKKKRSRKRSPSSAPSAPRAPRKKKTTAPPPALDDQPIAVDPPAEPWTPTMPPLPAPAPAPSPLPWRRPAHLPPSAASSLPSLPSLVIDDADPDRAERVREARAKSNRRELAFLPPILLDREQRDDAGSQRGLTLAVIILLIAATLTLSYLMRRPSSRGDGVTMLPTTGELVG